MNTFSPFKDEGDECDKKFTSQAKESAASHWQLAVLGDLPIRDTRGQKSGRKPKACNRSAFRCTFAIPCPGSRSFGQGYSLPPFYFFFFSWDQNKHCGLIKVPEMFSGS